MDEAPKSETSFAKELVLGIPAVTSDILRYFFVYILIAGPVFGKFAVQWYLESKEWPSWAAGLVGNIAGTGLAGAELAFAPVSMAVSFFGAMMAMILAFFTAGALLIIASFMGINPFKPSRLKNVGWFLASSTVWVYVLAKDARKSDKEARKKWDTVRQEREKQRAQQQADYAQILEQNQAEELAAEMEALRANENEIPAEVRQAA